MNELKLLLKLGAPIILANLATVSMTLVDTILVGPLGARALAGVGLGASTISGIGYPLACLLLGLDSEIARAVGAKDEKRARALLSQALLLCLAIATVQIAAICWVATHLDLMGVQAEIIPVARTYLLATVPGMLFFNISFAGAKFLQARNQTTPSVVITIVGNVLNGFLVAGMCYGRFGFPAMGIQGAGIATAIARAAMGLAYLGVFIAQGQLEIRWFDRKLVRELLSLGFPAAGQVLLEVWLFVGAAFMMARFDAHWVAAHQIVMQAATTTFMFPMGLSVAGAVRVGLALGEGNRAEALYRGSIAWRTSAAIMAGWSLLLITGGPWTVSLFNNDPLVLQHVAAIIGFCAAFQLFDGIQVSVTGVLRGFGDTRSPFFANLVGYWVIALPFGLWLAFGTSFGPPGVWAGLALGLVCVASLLLLRWRAELTRDAKQG